MPKKKSSKPRQTLAGLEAVYEAKLLAKADELRKQKGLTRELQRHITRMEREYQLKCEMSDTDVITVPFDRKRRGSKGRDEATFVLCCGDWHCGELVDPATVNNMNEYNPSIFERRVENVFDNALKIVEGHRKGWNLHIPNLLLGFLGDLMTGFLHEDQVITNPLTPQEELVLLRRKIRECIDFLLEHGSFRQVIIPCCYGNHGRGTHRRSHNAAARTSWETMLYQFLKEDYEGEDRIQWEIARGSMVYTPVYDHVIRWTHGDLFNYAGGIGGILIPLRRNIKMNWNPTRHADTTVIGHWHQELWDRDAVANNCLIGYSPYAMKFSEYSPPTQASFLVVEKSSRRVGYYPIWC